MNFIGMTDDQHIQVELKYCERCGGLWLRPQRKDGVHCASCLIHITAMPDPGQTAPRKARQRKKRDFGLSVQNEDIQKAVRIEYLQGAAILEVRI
jgi:Zn-finger nucleic acid-binding protein